MSKNKIIECPFCHSDEGYYDKNILSYSQYCTFDGKPLDSSEMMHVRGGKQKFCTNCGRRLKVLEK